DLGGLCRGCRTARPVAEEFLEHTPGVRLFFSACYLRRRALGDQSAATLSCLRTHIEDPIRLGHYVQIVFDHDCRVTGLDESVQYVDQLFDIRHVQAHGRLIEHVQRVLRLHTWPGTDVAAHLRELCNKLDALCFAAGQRWALLTQGQVPQADILQELQ